MHLFLTRYNQVSRPKLKEATQYASEYMVPMVKKVSVNCGVGDVATNGKAVEELADFIASITGQHPILTKARKAIAGFKIRQGMVVGMKVTLRGERMYDFLSKLTDVAIPRTRDFRGLNPYGITPNGSLNIGIKDASIFPEVAYGTLNHSLQVTVVSSAKNSEEARILFESLGFLFQKEEDAVKKPTKKSTRKRK